MTTLAAYNANEIEEVPRETLVAKAAQTWNPGDTEIICDSTAAAFTLTAPDPSLCVGKGHYNIILNVHGGSTKHVTVAFPNGPIDPGDQVMTAVADFVTCHATTDAWIVDSFETTTP